jgi:hypothetical protein
MESLIGPMCSCACRPAKEGSSVVCVSEFKFGGGEGEIKTRMVEGAEEVVGTRSGVK